MESTRSSRTVLTAFLLLSIALALCGALLLHLRQAPTRIAIHPPLPTDTPAPTPTHEPILVYVTGAVAHPEQLYALPWGSRVRDALEAAGGLTADAKRSAVNLAALIRDGDQIHVASSAADDADFALPTPSGGRRVPLNSASLAELQELPGVGPALAQRIIEYREQVGEFASLSDLDQVSGIGPATLENLKDLVSFD